MIERLWFAQRGHGWAVVAVGPRRLRAHVIVEGPGSPETPGVSVHVRLGRLELGVKLEADWRRRE